MSAPSAPLSDGDVVADKYRVDRVLGSGGMSLVVLAWHLELEQEVAIKVLHGRHIEGSEAVQRFRREARAAARIRSEHVARVLDVGTLANGSPFMVMEYLQGNDLDAELVRRGTLPVEEAVVYVMQAIDAIAEAHAAGIVHRDLKPENLFLAERADGSRILKVLDFGVSKSLGMSSVAELSLTKTTAFVGSPLYMSPEQVHSPRSVDPRSDIWSLGAILYQAMSGVAPFSGESLTEVCTRIVNEVPPALAGLRPGLPPGFETVVLRCLEKDRDQRYATVAELAHALAPFAAGAGVYAERAERVLSGAAIGLPATLQSLSLSW
ncbi:MAG TPA: serine/threonine-protein kinase, partial [Polyangiaceae bacterium]